MSRTIAALYDSRSEAEMARSRLLSHIRARSPRILAKDTAGALDGLKIARKDVESYRRGLQHGGHLLVAEVPGGTKAEHIVELLRPSARQQTQEPVDAQAADVEQGFRVEDPVQTTPKQVSGTLGQGPGSNAPQRRPNPTAHRLRSTEVQPPTDGFEEGDAVGGQPASPVAVDRSATEADLEVTPTVPASNTSAQAVVEEAHIPVVKEELRVGKRQVSRGRARVRSFTRETPVHEQVDLCDEEVQIDSRPSEQHLNESEVESAGLFKDRVFEIAEMREEAVVTKVAVVREEIIVQKLLKHRTETVHDTVRHTEVEIEDLPASEEDGLNHATRR